MGRWPFLKKTKILALGPISIDFKPYPTI